MFSFHLSAVFWRPRQDKENQSLPQAILDFEDSLPSPFFLRPAPAAILESLPRRLRQPRKTFPPPSVTPLIPSLKTSPYAFLPSVLRSYIDCALKGEAMAFLNSSPHLQDIIDRADRYAASSVDLVVLQNALTDRFTVHLVGEKFPVGTTPPMLRFDYFRQRDDPADQLLRPL